jgi:hypothetical protein
VDGHRKVGRLEDLRRHHLVGRVRPVDRPMSAVEELVAIMFGVFGFWLLVVLWSCV